MIIKKVKKVDIENKERKVIKSGNYLEIRAYRNKSQCNIRNITKDEYAIIDNETGQVKSIEKKNKSKNRQESARSLQNTFNNLRYLINTNVTDNKKILWVTLTYRQDNGPMTDLKRLYSDFKNFIKRLRKYINENYDNYKIEYINVVEPQASGAWHTHLILIFNKKRPFIANDKIEELWAQGFTKTKALEDNDNLANYLCAYLSDMQINEHQIAKNARQCLYPLGMNIYRTSKGIKKPTIYQCSTEQIEDIINEYKLEYEGNYEIINEKNEVVQMINKSFYKKKS